MADFETHTIDLATAGLELRNKEGAGLPRITGYAAVFGLSDNLGGHKEKVLPGAFTRTLEHRGSGQGSDPIKAFHNHNQDIVIGSTHAAPPTLRVEQDDTGLAHEIDPPDNAWGRPIIDAIERGDIDGMSIGFRVPQDGAVWTTGDDGTEVREISQIILAEVSTVSGWPAFPQTSVQMRSLMAAALEVETEEVPDTTDPAELRAWMSKLLIERATLKAGTLTQPTVQEARSHMATLAERYNLPIAPEPRPAQAPVETTQDVEEVLPEGSDSNGDDA